jgi:uncharacterized protein YbjT (DUF2867 family)
MRVFVAGATGAIGVRLVPLLIDAGHTVAGMTRSQPAVVWAMGAEPAVCDVFDPAALRAATEAFGPDVVVHQLTDLPDDPDGLESAAPANRRIRTEGTRNLVAAADGARIVAQSIAFAPAPEGHEETVFSAGGVILRYGRWYGPGTWHESGVLPDPPRIHIDEAARRTVAALAARPGSVLVLTDR